MDTEALEFIVRSHQAELYRYVKYLGADSVTASDVVQDAFLGAYRSKKVPDLNDEKARGAWLRAIARNTFLNYCRKRRARREIADPDVLDHAERHWCTEFLGEGDGFDYLEVLKGCLAKLTEKSRELIEQFYAARKSRTEMAGSFHMSEHGIKSSLRRVRLTLARCVKATLKSEQADGLAEI